jgi:DNA polymerase-3 subunit delta
MILLLFGKERFLKREAIADLKARLFRNPSEQDLNFQSFDGEEHGAAPVLDFLSTVPFLADQRMAVLWNVDTLADEEGQRLVASLGNLPSNACLVLETEETNTKKKALIRAIAEKAQSTACHTPFEKELPGWVETRARKKNLTLERGTALYLLGRVGADLSALDGVLNELKMYVHPRTQATVAEAAAIAPSNPDEDVFKLAELLMDERKTEALRLIDGLYRSGSRAPEIVAALAGQLERYKKASALLASGRPPSDIGEEMRVPRVFQVAFFQRLKKAPKDRLRTLQKALLECDESFKTGRAEERISVERFVLLT